MDTLIKIFQKSLTFYIPILFVCFQLIACGSSGGGDDGGPIIKQGLFLDSPVEGLGYTSGDQSGLTDAQGTFNYEDGNTVSFLIGDIVIGEAIAKPTMTPVDLVPGAIDETHPTVINIARFLLTIDDNGDPGDGILILEGIRNNALGRSIDFHQDVTSFENDGNVQAIVAELTALTTAGTRSLISAQQAQDHLRNTLITLQGGSVAILPGFPIGVSAVGADGQVAVNWNGVSGATSYNIYWNTTGGVTISDNQISNVISPHTHTGLTNGTTYYYIVTAVNSVGESSPSSEVSATPMAPVTVPNPPQNVQALGGNAQVTVSWNAVSGATSYNIYWNTTGGVTTTDNQIPNVTSPHIHTALTNGTTHYYIVTAVNSVGESFPSGEVSETPMAPVVPNPPQNVQAFAGDGQVTVSWNPASGASSYNLYMASQSGVTKNNYSSLPDGMKHMGVFSPFLHAGLTNGTTYYFVVTAVNVEGESLESMQVVGIPTPCVPGTFCLTGSMGTASSGHTATLLPNGKVLIVGGDKIITGGSSGALPVARAELYDPATGIFSPTGNMGVERRKHTTTLLSNGKVLIVGGSNGSGPSFVILSTAELYDPTTGTFSPTGSISTGHSIHTATLLSNGKVLVAGGRSSNEVFSSITELYDPTTGTFSPTGSMSLGRNGHTATLLSDNKVLIAGGNASTDLYDPVTGVFSFTGTMVTSRRFHAATVLSTGKVLIEGGGRIDTGLLVATGELYDPTTGTFNLTGSMSLVRTRHTATLLSGNKVLIAGGRSSNGAVFLSSTELYDPDTGTFSPTEDMNMTRVSHTATLLLNGKVLIAGGNLGNAELYNQ